MAKIIVGSRVAYSAKFLRSIACYTGEIPFSRGTVKGITVYQPGGFTLADIDWGRTDFPGRVNIKNLVAVADLATEAA